ncbi:MAG: cobaltochelatase CobT-related protein [Alphaproteobacteria bacterium]
MGNNTKQEFLNNQKIVATSLSKIIKKKNTEELIGYKLPENNNVHFDENNVIILRGLYDFKSLNLRFTNEKILKDFQPQDEYKKNIFKIFNSCRSLFFGFKEFCGCEINITKYFTQLNLLFEFELKKKDEILFKTLINYFKKSSSLDKSFKKEFPKIRIKDLQELKKYLKNQLKFSEKSLDIINKNFKSIEKETPNVENEDDLKSEDEKSSSKKKQQKLIKIEKDSEKNSKKKSKELHDSQIQENLSKKKKQPYKYFTKEFDLFINAKKLSKKEELIELRKQFEKEYFENSKLINKLVRKLDKLFNSLNYNSWKFDQENGYFDTSRFANFIANPNYLNIFKYEKETKEKNTVVSLLLDNSGSMRGKPIITSAITAEIITKVLEKCNVNVEILGFTTKEWKGGNSKKKWEEKGKVNFPGRLNDLLHIIYKDADNPWSNCKNNLGLILKEGILKENIDGEALLWAYNRLTKRLEKKKILIVISDGAPVDDSTLSLNYPDILDNHLKEIVERIEKKKKIQLLAIGIGHDVSKYYKNAFVIDDVKNLGDVIIDNLTVMLGSR